MTSSCAAASSSLLPQPALLPPWPCLARDRVSRDGARGLPTLPVCLCHRSTGDHNARPPTSAHLLATGSIKDRYASRLPVPRALPCSASVRPLNALRATLHVNSCHARRALRPLPSRLCVIACVCDVQLRAPIVLFGLDARDRPHRHHDADVWEVLRRAAAPSTPPGSPSSTQTARLAGPTTLPPSITLGCSDARPPSPPLSPRVASAADAPSAFSRP